jgi:hypothetical protein
MNIKSKYFLHISWQLSEKEIVSPIVSEMTNEYTNTSRRSEHGFPWSLENNLKIKFIFKKKANFEMDSHIKNKRLDSHFHVYYLNYQLCIVSLHLK